MKNVIEIYDVIEKVWWTENSICDKWVRNRLRDMKGDVTVRINSPGGDVFQAQAIHNMLKDHAGKIIVKIYGIAASAASIIAMAGDEIIMPANSMMMIHDPWTIGFGNAEELRKVAETLDKIKETIVNVYAGRSGNSKNEIESLMKEETWMTAEEAVAFGFADKETGSVKVRNFHNLSQFKNCPGNLQENMQVTEEPHGVERDEYKDSFELDLKERQLRLLEIQ